LESKKKKKRGKSHRRDGPRGGRKKIARKKSTPGPVEGEKSKKKKIYPLGGKKEHWGGHIR